MKRFARGPSSYAARLQRGPGSAPGRMPLGPRRSAPATFGDGSQWGMLSTNKRTQKITVGVIVGLVIVSLALSLVSVALA